MVEIEKPRITCFDSAEDPSYGKYVVEPLERGYGMTLGNSLRRILLSSLPGYAATSVKIAGVQHEHNGNRCDSSVGYDPESNRLWRFRGRIGSKSGKIGQGKRFGSTAVGNQETGSELCKRCFRYSDRTHSHGGRTDPCFPIRKETPGNGSQTERGNQKCCLKHPRVQSFAMSGSI